MLCPSRRDQPAKHRNQVVVRPVEGVQEAAVGVDRTEGVGWQKQDQRLAASGPWYIFHEIGQFPGHQPTKAAKRLGSWASSRQPAAGWHSRHRACSREPVAEIVPPPSEVRDLEDKPARYAALGIVEYLACHPGDLPDPEADDPGSPAKLRLFRLQPDGTYRQAMDAAAGFSRVCGTQVRLWQPNVRRMAHFQWWDKARGRWREAEHTREVERDRHARELQETRTASLKEGEAKMAVAALHSLLPALPTRNRDQVAAHWYRHGPPAVPADAGYTRRAR